MIKKLFFVSFVAFFACLAVQAAELGSDYQKVTDITTLATGDKVVLYCDDRSIGVTGWDGSKDAEVSATETEWVQYVVEVLGTSVYLKDVQADAYIAKPTGNHFKYGDKGACTVSSEGVFMANSRYLYANNSNYRMYGSGSGALTSGKPFYLYKVLSAGSTGPSESTEATITVASLLDFGTIEVGETFAAKELEVKGANITEMIADFEPATTAFTVAGALTAEGGTLTINCVATEIGTYMDTLVILATPTEAGAADVEAKVVVKAKIIEVPKGGKGTKEEPYSVSEAIALKNPNKEAWVIGYILGSINGGAAGNPMDNSAKTNIALGDTSNATTYMPVKIAEDAQAALNVKDNESNIGKRVKVYGVLKAYFNKPGIQTVSTAEQYEFVDDTATSAINSVKTETVVTRKVYENGQIYIVRDGVKYTIFGTRVE